MCSELSYNLKFTRGRDEEITSNVHFSDLKLFGD